MPTTLTIASSWDGQPLDPSDVARITLSLVDARLRVDVDAPWRGDPPPSAPPGPLWGLWDHEVVEVFIAGLDDQYTEIEIGPRGHHLVLQLHGRRNLIARELPLDLSIEREGDRWTATAWLDAELLPPAPRAANAYAIHGQGALRRYAAAHPVPGDAPDFHQLDRFAPVEL